MKTTEGKTPYELIPVEAMEEFALAMKEGAEKYQPNDWRMGRGMPWTWLIAAALRHTYALLRGEDIDPDSKYRLHHGAKLMCCGAMLLYYYRNKASFDKDDRFPRPEPTVGRTEKRISDAYGMPPVNNVPPTVINPVPPQQRVCENCMTPAACRRQDRCTYTAKRISL